MPRPQRPPTQAADALIAVAPLINRRIERLLANHDPPLTLTQFLTLRAIAAGEASSAGLARSTAVSGPAVSQLLAGLVDAGLLDRRELATDRRRRTLALSRHGQQTLASADALLRDRVASSLAGLPPPEADALAHALERIERTLSGAPPLPRRPPPRPPTPPRPPQRGHV